jgi:hypothetical protein
LYEGWLGVVDEGDHLVVSLVQVQFFGDTLDDYVLDEPSLAGFGTQFVNDFFSGFADISVRAVVDLESDEIFDVLVNFYGLYIVIESVHDGFFCLALYCGVFSEVGGPVLLFLILAWKSLVSHNFHQIFALRVFVDTIRIGRLLVMHLYVAVTLFAIIAFCVFLQRTADFNLFLPLVELLLFFFDWLCFSVFSVIGH